MAGTTAWTGDDGENEGAAAMGAEFVCPEEKENKTNSVNGRARREKE